MFVACGIWCLADVSSVSPSSEQKKKEKNSKTSFAVCSDEGLTLETSAKHHMPRQYCCSDGSNIRVSAMLTDNGATTMTMTTL